MRIIEPSQFKHNQPKKLKHRKLTGRIIATVLLLVMVAYSVSVFVTPLPAIAVDPVEISYQPARGVNIDWPESKQASIGTTEMGLLETHGQQKPVPIASIAKVVTALTVLDEKPLARDEPGPKIVVTPPDIEIYQQYVAKGGSVIPIQLGGVLTQQQLLIAMMLPSANNASDMLVNWAFGSMEEYLDRANEYVEKLGMDNTKIADASGFSPGSISTAEDLVLLATAAMDSPALADIVALKSAVLPVAGRVYSTNLALGVNGNIGIKTGTTDEAGGCFLFASTQDVAGGGKVTIVGVILGAPTTPEAIAGSNTLVQSVTRGFELVVPVIKGQIGANVRVPWQGNVTASSSSSVTVLNWRGDDISIVTNVAPPEVPDETGSRIGNFRVINSGGEDTAEMVLDNPVNQPSVWWRYKNAWPLNTVFASN